jgi:hypothetical protein
MGQWDGYTKVIEDENGELVRVLDPEMNISEIERIEKEIAALEVELAALKN